MVKRTVKKVADNSPDRITRLEQSIQELADAFTNGGSARKALGAVSLEYCEGPEGKVFVRIPDERGRWVLTDKCVVTVACPACKSIAGEPCKNAYMSDRGMTKYWAGTHCDRHTAAKMAGRHK